MGEGKYGPLAHFLASLPADIAAVTLTLAEIEQLLGSALPRGAYGRAWWLNSTNERARRHPRAWLSAGWRVAAMTPRTASPSVTFARRP
jgi:hypothetical protein